MFANARKTLANNQRQNGKENRQNAKPLRSAANNGATSGAGTFLQQIGPAEQKFSIFYDSDVEVRKQDRNQDGKSRDQLLLDKENKVFECKPETGAIPKRKNQTGLAVRGPQVRTNIAPPKPARKDKVSAENLAPKQDVNIVDEESPKKTSLSAENTPADYLLTEQERSSTCGISSQMKGIELTSAGGPIKKYVQVPFADLDISGKKQPSNRRPSSSSFSSNEKDSEDDKENDRVVPAEDISPPAYESQGADGLPTNCFAVPRPSVDKARVALYKLQEDEMCKVKEYSDDIFKYLREQEKLYLPRPGYMSNQPDLLPHMRCMLVDWLVEVAMEYKLSEACLFMAVSYVDRFLSYNKIYRTKLQLLGTTAMFIAAKVEEIYPPESEEFVFITDNTYTKEQVLKMETFILMALDFRMTCVTPFTFYSKFVLDTDVPESVAFLALYLLELVMMEGGDILNFLPSIQAASALALASHALMFGADWRAEFSKATRYTLTELAPCMSTMKIIWAKAANHDQQAVRQKYLEAKYKMVANTPICLTLPEDRRRP